MTTVVKSLSTRSFFQLCSDLKREREHYNIGESGSQKQQLWIAVFIMFVFFVWAIYALIRYQRDLPGWVVIVGIILLFIPAGPLLTLILVYYALGTGTGKQTFEVEATAAEGDEGGAAPPLLRPRPRPSSSELPTTNPVLVRQPGWQAGGHHCPHHRHHQH